jgi:hypothetical protein
MATKQAVLRVYKDMLRDAAKFEVRTNTRA